MPICTRRGCGVDFDPTTPSSATATATASQCTHHPGAPIFHEGAKSWSCCNHTNKPVLEFDHFLAIPGCAVAPAHTTDKQDMPQVKNGRVMTQSEIEQDKAAAEAHNHNATASSPPPTSNVTQPLSGATLAAATNAADAKTTRGQLAPTKVEQKDPDNKGAVELPSGIKCKRNACGFTNPGGLRQRAEEQCRFHPAAPIFHEGSKGWACCKRRVLDFNDFLAIEPCTVAESGHLFFGDDAAAAADGEAQGEEQIDCRMDHYETPNDIRLTVYAKAVETEKSSIKFDNDAIHFTLHLPPLSTSPPHHHPRGRKFQRTLSLFAPIDVDASSYTITKFKVDLVLVKAVPGQSWPALERGEKVLGYGLTFGRDKDK